MAADPADELAAEPPVFRRILLKISGEMLAGQQKVGIQEPILARVADEVVAVVALGVQVGLVVGGGNIFRGIAGAAGGMARSQADHMGMLATMINALALQDALERRGCAARVLSAVRMDQAAEFYTRRAALEHLALGRVTIFGAGTGNPYFSTDTAAALRAAEMGAEVILKGTRVAGVYDADPEKHPGAVFIPQLEPDRAVREGLRVMDITALTLCQENHLSIIVFDMTVPGHLLRVVRGEPVGTWVGLGERPTR